MSKVELAQGGLLRISELYLFWKSQQAFLYITHCGTLADVSLYFSQAGWTALKSPMP